MSRKKNYVRLRNPMYVDVGHYFGTVAITFSLTKGSDEKGVLRARDKGREVLGFQAPRVG